MTGSVLDVPLSDEQARRLAAAGRHYEKWRKERNALIFEAHKAGGSYREIGDLVGLSHVAVRKIVLNRVHNPPRKGSADDRDH